MSQQHQSQMPLSDNEYSSYLAFLVGYFFAALTNLQNSPQISEDEKEAIKRHLEQVRPMMERVYAESFRHPSA